MNVHFYISVQNASVKHDLTSPLSNRHVKGRVLVALADGTIAIFHRAVGNSKHSAHSRVLSLSATLLLSLTRTEILLFCVSPSRQSVGFNQLPPAGSGPTSPLHPLHDGGPRQGVVRLQEQDLRHPAQGHEDRGNGRRRRLVETSRSCVLPFTPPVLSPWSRSPSTLTPARRARCGSWPGSATASGCPSAWTPPSACSMLTPTSTCRTWTLSPTSARCWVRAVFVSLGNHRFFHASGFKKNKGCTDTDISVG